MKKLWMTLLVLLLTVPVCVGAQQKKAVKIPEELRLKPGGERALEHAMITAEREFSKLSGEKGIQEAFLTYLADDAIIFRPEPVSGRQWFSDKTDLKGSLSWEPAYVEIAGSGELGFSTGTYEYRGPSAAGKKGRPSYGHFVSVWEKKVVGWRVILDHGIAHSKPGAPSKTVLRPISETKKRDWDGAADALFGADRLFGGLSSQEAIEEAYKKHAEDDVRIYREGHLPLHGRKAAIAKLAKLPIVTSGEVEGAGYSRAEDLAFTYGTCTITDMEKDQRGPGSYVRVWRKAAGEDAWKLVLDLATPHPPKPEDS